MDEDFADFKIGIAGLGLIGGSLAKAFHSAGFFVAGFDIGKSTVDEALNTGAINLGACTPSVLYNCDIVFVALYPEGIVPFVKENAAKFKRGAILIDCCGIKTRICESLYSANLNGLTFIGGHPMAGTESNGFSASFAELFSGASFILTPRPGEDDRILQTLDRLLCHVGFARTVVTTPQHHDRMIAFTSQLPHVIACAYVLSPSLPDHEGFSAGSFRDVSRVAHINPELWAQLFIDNKDALCTEIDLLIENLQGIRELAFSGDANSLKSILKKSRTATCGGANSRNTPV
jgi:prephenate dehydrogenase